MAIKVVGPTKNAFFSKKFKLRLPDTTVLAYTAACVRLLSKRFITWLLTRAVSDDMGGSVRPLPHPKKNQPSVLLTRPVSADMGGRVRPLFSNILHIFSLF